VAEKVWINIGKPLWKGLTWIGVKGRESSAMYAARGHKGEKNEAWWVSKMTLQSIFHPDKFIRSKHQTEALIGRRLDEKRRQVATAGGWAINADCTEAELAFFNDRVMQMSDEELMKAAGASFNSPEIQGYFQMVLDQRRRINTVQQIRLAGARS